MDTVYITAEAMRERFNALDLGEKLRKGEVRVTVKQEHQAPPRLGFPEGTMSQLVEYIGGNGKLLATAHRYKDPNGKLLASGKEDPKTLREGDTLYQLIRKPQPN